MKKELQGTLEGIELGNIVEMIDDIRDSLKDAETYVLNAEIELSDLEEKEGE